MSGRSSKQEEALLSRALQCVEGVVTSFARKYAGLIDEAEAGSEANLAVVEVVRRYDEARDPTFDAYVRSWARGFIMKFVKARTLEQVMERAARHAGELVRATFRNDEAVRAEDPEVPRRAFEEHAEELSSATFVAGTEAQRRWAAVLAEEAEAQRHAAEADTPEARYEHAESMHLLGEAMPELPQDERVIIEALYFDLMWLNEVEPVLGVSEGTVRRRYARAKRRLAKALMRLGMKAAPELSGVPVARPVLKGLTVLQGGKGSDTGQGGRGGGGRRGGPGRGGGRR